jgi:hypothetical protein
MLQFDTATVVTSNRFSVNRQAVSSHNREMLGEKARQGPLGIADAPTPDEGTLRPPSLGAPWGRARPLEGERMYPLFAL